MRKSGFLFLTMAVAATSILASTVADAGGSYRDGGFVTAYSRQGTTRISAPIRHGSDEGWQVQLPSGRWISCMRSCEETLRVQTIDFFESSGSLSGYGSLQRQCGIFGCLNIR